MLFQFNSSYSSFFFCLFLFLSLIPFPAPLLYFSYLLSQLIKFRRQWCAMLDWQLIRAAGYSVGLQVCRWFVDGDRNRIFFFFSVVLFSSLCGWGIANRGKSMHTKSYTKTVHAANDGRGAERADGGWPVLCLAMPKTAPATCRSACWQWRSVWSWQWRRSGCRCSLSLAWAQSCWPL